MSRRDDERVADILDAASEIGKVIELGRDAWDKDRVRQLAVERLLEIIGEAANSLSEEFRAQHPAIPWRDIIGLRVVLAHHYHRVDPGQVWAIAATFEPSLRQTISAGYPMYARPGPTTPDEGTAWACAAYRPGKFNALAKDAGRLGAHLLANAFR